jgi:hypothetical protein
MRVAALLCAGLAALVLPRAAAAEDAALTPSSPASGPSQLHRR